MVCGPKLAAFEITEQFRHSKQIVANWACQPQNSKSPSSLVLNLVPWILNQVPTYQPRQLNNSPALSTG